MFEDPHGMLYLMIVFIIVALVTLGILDAFGVIETPAKLFFFDLGRLLGIG